MIRIVRWIRTELRDLPIFNGTKDVQDLMEDISLMIPEEHLVPTLDITLRSTPSKWWATHKENLGNWEEVQPTLQHRFNPPPEYQVIDILGVEEETITFTKVYQGRTDPALHADGCAKRWTREGCLEQYWVHKLIYTLGPIPKAWYLHEDIF